MGCFVGEVGNYSGVKEVRCSEWRNAWGSYPACPTFKKKLMRHSTSMYIVDWVTGEMTPSLHYSMRGILGGIENASILIKNEKKI